MPDGAATEKRLMTVESINEYLCYLCEQEKSQATVEKYQRDIKALIGFLNNRPVSKQLMVAWKQHLAETYAVASVNSMLAAANSFMDFIGWPEYKIKAMKVQKKLFCSPDKELTKDEYYRLVHTAMRIGKERLCLVIQTIGATGIRISELKFITVEAVASGRAIVNNKGKTRVVLLPTQLCCSLKKYARKLQKTSGLLFDTKNGKELNRSNIWRDMKALCQRAGVDEQKVFPHNLRHLFARLFYALKKDLFRLADILGHSNVNTTRIYTAESGIQHMRQINKMRLVIT